MWEVFTLGRTIPWSLTDFAWLIILFFHTSFIKRWKFLLVTHVACFIFIWMFGISFHLLVVLANYVNNVLSVVSCLYITQRPHKAYPVELAQFHSADYVEFLHRITPDTQHLFSNELAKCMTFELLFIWFYVICFCFTHNEKHYIIYSCLLYFLYQSAVEFKRESLSCCTKSEVLELRLHDWLSFCF